MIKNNKVVKYIISERGRYTKSGLGFGIVYNMRIHLSYPDH